MDQTLYLDSLKFSLSLLLFFGGYMLFAPTPDKKVFANYLLSRRLMGTALLILAINYMVHICFAMRQSDLNATILLNESTYFLCYWLFSSAMMTLLDRRYITRRQMVLHLALWVLYSVSAWGVSALSEGSAFQAWGTAILTILLVIYGSWLSIRLLRTYARATRLFENTHSDDISSYIRWLSIFTYWAIAYGVSCGLLTFLPNRYIFIWILSSIPFYIYLFCSYQNYLLFHERVENALHEEAELDNAMLGAEGSPIELSEGTDFHDYLDKRIKEWIDHEGYLKSGITLQELSVELCTNRTYLSVYINTVYDKTFRDWITDLRIEYAKRLMIRQPQLMIAGVADASGFVSTSHFARTFKTKEGCTPTSWRDANRRKTNI